MLVIWHSVVFHVLLSLKVFDEGISHIDVDLENGILAIGNIFSIIKTFRI